MDCICFVPCPACHVLARCLLNTIKNYMYRFNNLLEGKMGLVLCLAPCI